MWGCLGSDSCLSIFWIDSVVIFLLFHLCPAYLMISNFNTSIDLLYTSAQLAPLSDENVGDEIIYPQAASHHSTKDAPSSLSICQRTNRFRPTIVNNSSVGVALQRWAPKGHPEGKCFCQNHWIEEVVRKPSKGVWAVHSTAQLINLKIRVAWGLLYCTAFDEGLKDIKNRRVVRNWKLPVRSGERRSCSTRSASSSASATHWKRLT